MTTALHTWLTEQCQLRDYRLELLAGDASLRQYFRIHTIVGSYVAMDASLEKQTCLPFVAIANTLRTHGLHSPKIFASDFEQGFLLLADFGHQLYLKELNSNNATILYQRALDVLCHMQNCATVEGYVLKFFNTGFMRNELELFREWFLEKHLAITLDKKTVQLLNDIFDFLIASAVSQPQVFMHRDYHSANLMLLPDNQVGILDFQDACVGPITYDVVSLLRDCYIAWPEKLVEELLFYFWKKLTLPGITAPQFFRWFDLMGLQRHLKALLTFSRKYRRDHNANYLQHIPRTLNYILTVSERYSECHALNNFLKQVVIEKCVP